MLPSCTKNRVRAIREGSRERTSQRPSPRESTSGKPSGHPYCTALTSQPTCLRSPSGSSFNHSRTGSLPAAVR